MRPNVTVTINEVLPRRAASTRTGTAFAAVLGTTAGLHGPFQTFDDSDSRWTALLAASTAPVDVEAHAKAMFANGVADLYVAVATGGGTPDWAAALALFTADLGPGQVLIPGVGAAAGTHHAALLAHGAATGRTALLDTDPVATVGNLTTLSAALTAAAGSTNAALLAFNGTGSVPASAVVAGLIARGDARVGHANHAPAGPQGGILAGVITGATLTGAARFTDANLNTLHDAGINVIKTTADGPTLYGFRSLSNTGAYQQLSVGRLVMQVEDELARIGEQFLFRTIDGRGQLYAEFDGAIRGYLLPLWRGGALYGEVADDAFDVEVIGINTPVDAAAGRLKAQVEIKASSHAETVFIDIDVALAAA